MFAGLQYAKKPTLTQVQREKKQKKKDIKEHNEKIREEVAKQIDNVIGDRKTTGIGYGLLHKDYDRKFINNLDKIVAYGTFDVSFALWYIYQTKIINRNQFFFHPHMKRLDPPYDAVSHIIFKDIQDPTYMDLVKMFYDAMLISGDYKHVYLEGIAVEGNEIKISCGSE